MNAAAILLAHHADDQVETVLMHLLRGSGLAGLRGILPIAPFPFTIDDLRFTIDDSPFPPLLRPFLTTTRPEIEAYCQEHNLTPMQDESNQDTRIRPFAGRSSITSQHVTTCSNLMAIRFSRLRTRQPT